jgi:hypothetical protein
MMSTIDDQNTFPSDNWDPAVHTTLENAMRRVLVVLIARTFQSNIELVEFIRANPVIWGNE